MSLIVAIFEFLASIFSPKAKNPEAPTMTKLPSGSLGSVTMREGSLGDKVKVLQRFLGIKDDGVFGPKTKAAVIAYQKANGLVADGVVGPKTRSVMEAAASSSPAPSQGGVPPIYPSPHRFHPRFDHLLPKPFTHLHPFDILRSVAGEREIPGKQDNELIAHFHEHSGNLGAHSDSNDYADEVPHCASAWNWACDMGGCEKSDNALASSFEKYPEKFGSKKFKKGERIPRGTLICLDGHITSAADEFTWTGTGVFSGFGSNQGNTIKSSVYQQSRIRVAFEVKPKAGTVLAPIGFLGEKPIPATGSVGESTR